MAVNVKGFLYVIHTPFSVNLICVVVYFFILQTPHSKKSAKTLQENKKYINILILNVFGHHMFDTFDLYKGNSFLLINLILGCLIQISLFLKCALIFCVTKFTCYGVISLTL